MVRDVGVYILLVGIALAAGAASVVGLVGRAGDQHVLHTSVRGEPVEIYGSGVYQHESLFSAGGNRGTDALTLVMVPALLVGAAAARRGGERAVLGLAGILLYFVYVYATRALGAAYNELFLVNVLVFSASTWALVLLTRSLDGEQGQQSVHRWPAIFMFVSGAVTLIVWMMAPVADLVADEPPERLEHATTLFTNALDMALIVPATAFTGLLLWRGRRWGVRFAVPLLILEFLLLPLILLQSVFQVEAGVSFEPAEFAGPIVGFTLLAVLAGWVLVVLMRATSASGGPVDPNPAVAIP